ncbi:amidase [Bradyrhizobium brasilense]|uniref:Amidase n=2 Tax=Bradyrhizobium brasilense TaxID=1419277 RepID=A0A1G7Q7F6_9BRAD|nr:amidase [Bradyrhizobium brasilense]
MVRMGLISCREVVQSAIDRLQQVNPRINAVVHSFPEESLAEADKVDCARRRGEALGPLSGVPVTIKVNVDQKGHPTDDGAPASRTLIATEDSPVVSSFRRAGAIIIGRTNMPARGLRWFTANSLHGLTVNPWSKVHTVGGSSGGAAAAVSVGIGAIAHGNDLGGSIRYPAYCCGVAGLRPTNGLIPAFNPSSMPVNPISRQLMAVQGALARRVRDVRLATRVLSVDDLRDPRLTIGSRALTPKRAKRAALLPIWADHPAHPATQEAVRSAGRALARAGYEVDEVAPPRPKEAADLWRRLAVPDVLARMAPYVTQCGDADAVRSLELLRGCFPATTPADALQALDDRMGLLREWQLFLADWPTAVMPISTQPPFMLDEDIRDLDSMRKLIDAQAPLLALSALGLPSASVPAGLHEGLPIGVQVVAGRFQDELCLDGAEVIEAHLGLPTPIDPIG